MGDAGEVRLPPPLETARVMMWDNRWTLHVVEPFDHGRERRVMHRTTIAGTEPVRG